MTIDEKLRILIKKKGVNRTQAWRDMGNPRARATFQRWFTGDVKPHPADLVLLAKYFDVSLSYLADDDVSIQTEWKSVLMPGEESILEVVRGLGLDTATAIRRLMRSN